MDNTTELYMIKYTFGEIFSSGGETLPKNPSDQTVKYDFSFCTVFPILQHCVVQSCIESDQKKVKSKIRYLKSTNFNKNFVIFSNS